MSQSKCAPRPGHGFAHVATMLLLGLALSAAPSSASAQSHTGGPFGLGIIVGQPTGLSLKYFLDTRHALDAAANIGPWDDRGYVHGDYVFHFPLTLGGHFRGGPPHVWFFTIGIGGKVVVFDHHHHDANYHDRAGDIAVRVPFGFVWHPGGVPIDVFAEAAPCIYVIPDLRPEVDVGLGVRYYF